MQGHGRKAFGEENSDTLCLFLCDPFSISFQNNFSNNVRTKIDTAESDSPRRTTLLCQGLRSFCGALVPWGIGF